jgi:hypothetical protein
LLGGLLGVAVVAAACGGGTSGSSGTTPPTTTAPPNPTTPAVTTPPTSETSPSSTPAAAGDLSGTWSGQYSGAYKGTFTLHWTQTGSKLTGTIDVSSLNGTLPITGTVNGSAIQFGTVGSTEITYSGSVSGDSMSGTYEFHTASGTSGGPWSATKSS